MNNRPLRATRSQPLGILLPSLLLGTLTASCLDGHLCPSEPAMHGDVYDRLRSSQVDKVDVVLDIDNSSSMSDKQALLALAVPDLVAGLVNPACLDKNGAPVTPGPKSPLEPCPAGSARAFEPLLDIHIGVVSSSLGSHGADTCPVDAAQRNNNDMGRLLSRKYADSSGALPTYQGKGFLAWDPAQLLSPPGEADLSADSGADPDNTALVPVLTDMIKGTGENGCGYESQLESWYRFLVDPAPYASIGLDAEGRVKTSGVDDTLLAQRKAFLRPDSLLAIVMLTDENDCSVRESGQFYQVLQSRKPDGSLFNMPAARAVCETNPEDPCCFSCAQKGPKDDKGNPVCPEDPTCKDESGQVKIASNDPIGLRCWDQKRRFGIDFLYPIDRYTSALTSEKVTAHDGQIVQNPIFSDLDPDDKNFSVRDPSMVILTGIVGVPWQDIARDPKDLTKGFKSPDELADKDAQGRTSWDIIAGDPQKNVKPFDPLMLESIGPRSGKNPVTGDEVATSATPLANPINGHDSSTSYLLQYACLFDLPKPIDCSTGTCDEPDDSPVYDPPYDQQPTVQVRAGGRPATRVLSLLKSLGSQGQPASICPAQTSNPGALDYGYRPAMAAALSRLQDSLVRSCLPRTLDAKADGQVSCAIVEARHRDSKGACCNPEEARVDPAPERASFIDSLKGDAAVTQQGYDCFCEIPQLTGKEPGEPLWTCQNDTAKEPALADGTPVDGYCYIDETSGVGNPALVAKCPDTEKRSLRFVGKGNPGHDATIFITCGVTQQSPQPACDSSL